MTPDDLMITGLQSRTFFSLRISHLHDAFDAILWNSNCNKYEYYYYDFIVLNLIILLSTLAYLFRYS